VTHAIATGRSWVREVTPGSSLSQLLRGLVEKFPKEGDVDTELFVESLEHADVLARQAVVRPIGGRYFQSRAPAPREPGLTAENLTAMVRGARERAREALAYTPNNSTSSRSAGVVDSGGSGCSCLWFEALCTCSPATLVHPAARARGTDSRTTSKNNPRTTTRVTSQNFATR